MSKNIYSLFREYNKLHNATEKSKYIVALDNNTRETFKSLVKFSDNSERFDITYDGWINSLDEELVVLEIYSVILKTRSNLQKFCVDSSTYKQFIDHKKGILTLLLENKQYKHAKNLLEVHMFNEDFKETKLEELRVEVLKYLISKKMILPKKLIKEIYKWVDDLILPSYLVSDLEGDFKFTITNDALSIVTLQADFEDAYKKPSDLKKIVDNLVYSNKIKNT